MTDAAKEWKWRRECPRFNGLQSEYEVWRDQVEDWLIVCGKEIEFLGMEIRLSLKGKAYDIAKQIDRDTLKGSEGSKIILEKLDRVFLKDTLLDSYVKMKTYLKIERESGEKMRDYLIRYEKTASECSQAIGRSMFEGETKGCHVIEQANLTDTQKQMVLAACGRDKLNYDAVSQIMKRIFEGLGDKEENEWLGSENYTNTGSGRGKDEWWGSERNLNTGSGRGKEGSRNRGRPRWIRGRGGRNPINKEGRVTLCAVCNSEWHWARDCPQNFQNRKRYYENTEIENRPRNNQEKEREEEKIYIGEVRKLDGESWGDIDAILDTGCKSTVCGEL